MKSYLHKCIAVLCATISTVSCTYADQKNFVEVFNTTPDSNVTQSSGNTKEHTLYQTGSIAKYICSLAILDMHQQGVLNLTETLDKALPGYNGKSAKDIQIIHLLQNRSGLKDDVIAAFQKDPNLANKTYSGLQASNLYASSKVQFEPGSEFGYIIANWILVQAILETLDEKPLANILQERVFTPAGMSNSFAFTGNISSPLAAEPIRPATPIPNFVSCAGGVASTAGDLLKLAKYPYQSKRLSKASKALFMTISTPEEGYALGGRYMEKDGRLVSWQSGSNGPFKSIAIYDPAQDLGYAIVTANDDKSFIDKKRDIWLKSVNLD